MSVIGIDHELVRLLREQAADEMTRAKQQREIRGLPELSQSDEYQLAMSAITTAVQRKHSVGVLSGTWWWHGVMTDRADARRCWWRAGLWSGGGGMERRHPGVAGDCLTHRGHDVVAVFGGGG